MPATARRASAAPAVLFRAPARPISSVSEQFTAWRDLARRSQAPADHAPADQPAAEAPVATSPAMPSPAEARLSWRDDIVAWSRAILSGAIDHGISRARHSSIDVLAARFDLSPALSSVLALLYGAHLCGERGAAPADVARLLDHRWDEALGRGELADRGIAIYAGSRVALSPLVLRVLDELPPVTGTLVGEPGPVALLGPCVVVAGDEPLTTIAERCLTQINGAILAARGEPDCSALLFEARARGAAAMLRATLTAPPADAAIFVIDNADLAERLGIPRLA
jgi:hypothetical protein